MTELLPAENFPVRLSTDHAIWLVNQGTDIDSLMTGFVTFLNTPPNPLRFITSRGRYKQGQPQQPIQRVDFRNKTICTIEPDTSIEGVMALIMLDEGVLRDKDVPFYFRDYRDPDALHRYWSCYFADPKTYNSWMQEKRESVPALYGILID